MIVVVNRDEAGGGSALKRCDGFNQCLDQGNGSELDFRDSLSLLVDFIKKYRIRLRDEVQLRTPFPQKILH